MNIRPYILLILSLLALPIQAQSDSDPFEVNVEIKLLNKAGTLDEKGKSTSKYENRAFKFGLLETEAKAKAILEKAEKFTDINALNKFLDDNEIVSFVGIQSQGRFKRKVLAGMAFLVIIPMEMTGVVIPIKAGQVNYEGTIEYQALTGATAKGKNHVPDIIEPVPPEPDGDSITFPISYRLDAKWAKKDTRVIIQTYMVDCSTEDTVACCPPVIYEGIDYHTQQDKRMGFDYYKNDTLSVGYREDRVIQPGVTTFINTFVKMKKPNIKKNYQGPYKVSVEDYHHVYFQEWIEGTCLQMDPFKLLDYAPTLGEMELTEDFRQPAESQFGEDKKALNLRYEVGKFEYIDDSLNNVQLDAIVKQLDSYGEYLVNYDIEGYASPDGNYEKNKELARKRGENAAQAINYRMTAKVRKPNISVKVCTWDEVVSELKRRGKMEIAEKIQEIIDTHKSNDAIYLAVKALPEYDEMVTPVLESQRKMACSIMFRRPHVLNAEEVVERFFADKNRPESERFDFSEGDYFNLLNNLDSKADSADIDSVTVLAYNYCKEKADFLSLKLTPYIANKMAMLMIKRGHPDTKILEPFLDYSIRTIGFNKGLDEIRTLVINRREHILNQAVAYYMEEKLDTANYWLERIKNLNMPGAIALKNIITLRKNYKKENSLSGELESEYKIAKDFILNSSDDNKAILYTEIPKWNMRAEAERYVNAMSNDNPKKWYLKGILWADDDRIKSVEASEATDDIETYSKKTTFKKLSDEEIAQLSSAQKFLYDEKLKEWEEEQSNKQVEEVVDDTVSTKGIPYYLAYFQHSFDLNPSLKKYYYDEGHVKPELRRKYQYKIRKKPAYRKLFRKLKSADDIAHEAAAAEKKEEEERQSN